MVDHRIDLARLEQVARLKADIELKKFAAFRRHIATLQGQVDQLEAALLQEYDRDAGTSAAQMRLAHACTRHAAAAHMAAEAELHRLTPAFEAARSTAQREFGRAEVLGQLDRLRQAELHRLAQRRSG